MKELHNIFDRLISLLKKIEAIKESNLDRKNFKIKRLISEDIDIHFLIKCRKLYTEITGDTVWTDAKITKPDNFIIKDGIIRSGEYLAVVECLWDGNKWVITGSKTVLNTNNVIYWTDKRAIPDEIAKMVQT